MRGQTITGPSAGSADSCFWEGGYVASLVSAQPSAKVPLRSWTQIPCAMADTECQVVKASHSVTLRGISVSVLTRDMRAAGEVTKCMYHPSLTVDRGHHIAVFSILI